MFVWQLTKPQHIVVVGGSDNFKSPGGKVLQNLIASFDGRISVLNPKHKKIQGLDSFATVAELSPVDMAIFAIPARFIPPLVGELGHSKQTKAFIVLSAGFAEDSPKGKALEAELLAQVQKVGGQLIGPNCIGLITPNFNAAFTTPIPKPAPNGIDLISSSGATAVFIMEMAMKQGLHINNLYSVGNAAQIGIEEVLAHLDTLPNECEQSHLKLLYLESLRDPTMFLKHARSLVSKGYRVLVLKAGRTQAGSRAASSHTGALASPDVAVDSLFQKAGVLRCENRQELVSMAILYTLGVNEGLNIGIVTHAGGPAVILTDALASQGFTVPELRNDSLAGVLLPGSSVGNPIDILATGKRSELNAALHWLVYHCEEVDSVVVIFGSPGLNSVSDEYALILEYLHNSPKPIYPILPSVLNANDEMQAFVAGGGVFFYDESVFAAALGRAARAELPSSHTQNFETPQRILLANFGGGAYLSARETEHLLAWAGIRQATAREVHTLEAAKKVACEIGFPLVIKVIGPVHKTEMGGVVLNIQNLRALQAAYKRLSTIVGVSGILIQTMHTGMELYVGGKREAQFGNLLLFGQGGIYLESIQDTACLLGPVSENEVLAAFRKLRVFPIWNGLRRQKGIPLNELARIICQVSLLLEVYPQIVELDLNPLIVHNDEIVVVDARIRLA
jgi:acetyltransferase